MSDSNGLDFSVLDSLTGKPANGGEQEEGADSKDIPGGDGALKTHSRASEGIYPKLEAEKREKERQADAADRQIEIYRAYQDAIKRGGVLMSEITKGIPAGKDPARLLLKACEIIGAMVGDNAFYEQNRQNLIAIHGAGLLEPVPLTLELEDVRRRLAMLTRPELDNEPPVSRERIDRAIRAHRDRAATIEARIRAAGTKE